MLREGFMSNWSEGYTSDINYTMGYYDSLSSQNVIPAFLMSHLQPPKILNACELGFGFGVSINLHAAASKVKWYGTDFNPSQTLFAQQIANEVNPDNLKIFDQSFAEFCQREDLPDFDLIALHGIWSWISPNNRDIIVDFIRRKLKVGGVVYISYNTLPGWSAKTPIRHLLDQYYRAFSSAKESREETVKSALDYTKQLFSVSTSLLQRAPQLIEQVEQIEGLNSHYVIHEYLNQSWHPMYFSELEECLREAKLSYACSSSFLDDFSDVLFTEEQKTFFDGIQDPILQQTAKDFILNKQFRRDYWVKGQLNLNDAQVEQEWRKLRVLLVVPVDDVSSKISHYQSVEWKEDLLKPVLEQLSDHQIHSVDALCEALKEQMSVTVIFKILALLISRKNIVIAQSAEIINEVKEDCKRFNQAVVERVFSPNKISVLASPVSGMGVQYTNIDLLFISAHLQKIKQKDWEQYAYKMLQQHNQLLLKEEQTISGEQETLEELSSLKQKFLAEKFNVSVQLGIIPKA